MAAPQEDGVIHVVEVNEETSFQVYTDSSIQEQGVGTGVVIFKGREMIAKFKFKLENRCSKNQGGKLTILKALEKLDVLTRQSINPFSTTIFTECRITLASLLNYKIHGFLVGEIRK